MSDWIKICEENKGELRSFCRKKGLANPELFISFMIRRFGESTHHKNYIREWIGRFKRGNPLLYMDSESKEKFMKVIEEDEYYS